MTVPVYQNTGPARSDTVAMPGNAWPNGHVKYDICVFGVQTANEALPATPAGFARVTDPIGLGAPGTPGSVMISLYWARATAPGMPNFDIGDSGNHQYMKPFLIRGAIHTGDPFNAILRGTDPVPNLAISVTGPDSTVIETLVMYFVAHAIDQPTALPNPPGQWEGEANAALANLVERADAADTRGTGGAFCLWTGEKNAIGPTGTLTVNGTASAVARGDSTVDVWTVLLVMPEVSPITAALELETPYKSMAPGGGGAFTQLMQGPDGTWLGGSDLAGGYMLPPGELRWINIGNQRGMTVPHVRAAWLDVSNRDRMFLGSEHGLFLSKDHGETWARVSPDVFICWIEQSRNNPNRIYMSTAELYNSPICKIYRSDDRGDTWALLADNLPGNLRGTKILCSHTNPDIVYLCSANDAYITAPTFALFKSTDGGVNWTSISGAIGNVLDFDIHPTNHDILYATTFIGTIWVPPYSGEVWKTTDGGASWVSKAPRTGSIYVNWQNGENVLVVDTARDPGHAEEGLFETLDGGATWARRSGIEEWEFGYQNGQWAWGRQLYSAAIALGRSLLSAQNLAITTAQWGYISKDRGFTFQNVYTRQPFLGEWITTGFENTALQELKVSKADGTVYAALSDLGLWASRNRGVSLHTCNSTTLTGDWNGFGGSGITLAPDPDTPGLIFAAIGETGMVSTIYKNANYGERTAWVPANTGLPASDFFRGLTIDPRSTIGNRRICVTAGTNGDIYRTNDHAATWALVDAAQGMRHMAIDCADSLLWIAGGEGGLRRSQDGGATWAAIGGPDFVGAKHPSDPLASINWTGVLHVEADPIHSGRFYVTVRKAGGGLYVTYNRGDTWTKLYSTDFPRAVAVNPSNALHIFLTSSRPFKSGGLLYDASAPLTSSNTSEGVLVSKDGGLTFKKDNGNLPWTLGGPVVFDLADPFRVYIGSPGNGYFYRDLDEEVVEEAVNPYRRRATSSTTYRHRAVPAVDYDPEAHR